MIAAPMLDMAIWIPILDGDAEARALYDRHYSRRVRKDGKTHPLFVGPGQKFVLSTLCRRALFVWRKYLSDDGQTGINCAVFRNEGAGPSSDLIRAADALADARWPAQRHFTYVDPRRIALPNAGYCFLMAGWRRIGRTKHRDLIIMERPACY